MGQKTSTHKKYDPKPQGGSIKSGEKCSDGEIESMFSVLSSEVHIKDKDRSAPKKN